MRLFALLILSLPCFAQQADRYVATAATTKFTLQQPAANARQISFGDDQNAGASVYCASASTATFSWQGAAATTTAAATAEKKLPGTQQASGMTPYTASDVGSGTTGPAYNVPAGATMNFSLTWFRFGTGGTTANISIATSNSCTITFYYSAV